MSASPPADALPRLAVRAGLVLAALLLVAAAAAFFYASQIAAKARLARTAAATTVTITAHACEPNELTVAAGPNTFRIVNGSDRAVEWEILDGVMVVEERENIAPGFTATLGARLAAGDYAVTCGLLSNPRGRLHVTPSAAASAASRKDDVAALIGALAEYKVYLATETAEFTRAAGLLSGAVAAGDLRAARALYEPARAGYAHIAPISEVFSDLDTAIDARADYFEQREADPAFGGLHRIEYSLFARGATQGLVPVAAKLATDAQSLQARIHDLRVTPDAMIGGAASVMNRFATEGAGLEEDRYAHTDIDSLAAALAGVRKIVGLLRPLEAKAHGDLVAALDADLATLDTTLASHRDGTGFVAYDRLDAAAKGDLAKQAATLAADLSRLRESMGAGS